ncbi:UrcA family protein [Phenylobacterium sp.]|jgi:UrcA family protein|uniref:UrcA family protein n=1 Tax=Phenylobacterium sp. TaxID=1871053 RepID=UPI002F3E4730
MKRVIPAGVALALLAGAASASTATMRIHVGDLEPTTSAGAQEILSRIDIAARQFCTVPGEWTYDAEYWRCHRTMVATAVKSLDAPLVTALYDQPQPTRFALR